jgi:P2X purinoceptor 4
LCDPSKNSCIHGQALPIGNGVMTGNCIVSQLNASLYVCEVEAWCPLEQDILPL